MKRIFFSTVLLIFGFYARPGNAADFPPKSSAFQEALVPGIIDFADERNKGVLSAPSTVGVREDFEIRILTFGGGCEREGDSSLIVSAAGADVT